MNVNFGYLGTGCAVALLFALHAGCGGVAQSDISSTTCGTNPSCYVTHANGLCQVDPNATCEATGAWVCGPGGVLGSGCLSDGGIAPPPLDAGAGDAAADATTNCGDFAEQCFTESNGACVGSPIYPSCVNGQVQCPAGTILQSDCPVAQGYLACMDSQGTIDASLKTCQSDNDCVIAVEETDCCGSRLYVGIQSSSAGTFASCETAWEAHFPGCGCASDQTKTEDGKVTNPNTDGGAPHVHCTDFTMSGGICKTYVP